jgi:isopentenyl diphosphate isomerase/L-lactate dehydrogenase-like FMN-dependent dehydrogenase
MRKKLNEEPDKHGFRYQAAAARSVIEQCRKRSGLPIILGIATKEDAEIAIDHGWMRSRVQPWWFIWITVSAVDALLEVVDMAANRVEVGRRRVHSRFRRGQPWRGAKAVAIANCRAGAGAAGEAGVTMPNWNRK